MSTYYLLAPRIKISQLANFFWKSHGIFAFFIRRLWKQQFLVSFLLHQEVDLIFVQLFIWKILAQTCTHIYEMSSIEYEFVTKSLHVKQALHSNSF